MKDFNKIDESKSIHYNYVTNYYQYKDKDYIVTFKYLGDSQMKINIGIFEYYINLDDYEKYDGDELYDRIAYDIIKNIENENLEDASIVR